MKKRRKNDFYPTTSEWITEQLLNRVPVGGTILEPCSGELDMAKVLSARNTVGMVITNDIDPTRPAQFHLDARLPDLYLQTKPSWVISNPPFNQAIEIVQQSYIQARVGIAMLLRLSFLEPTQDRGPWLYENPPNEILVLPRHSFTGDGKTDSVTTAWMVWRKYGQSQTITIVPRARKS